MPTPHRSMAPPAWLALAVLMLVPLAARGASLIDTAPFSTAGQSMWGPGEAVIFDYDYFLGPEWDESAGVDLGVAELYAYTTGKIGPELSLHLNSGSVDVTYPVSVSLEFPEQVPVGEPFTISSSYSVLSGYSMTTASPTGSAYAGLRFQVTAGVGGSADIPLLGTKYFGGNIVNINEGYTLVDVDSTTPYTKQLGDYGQITAQIPTVNTTGTLDGHNLVSTGSGDIVQLDVDLDNLLSEIPYFPPLEYGQRYEVDVLFDTIYVAEWQVSLLDVDASLGLDLEQSFTFDPELTITLDLGNGEPISFLAGESVDILMPDVSVLTLDPSYTLANTFTADTDLLLEGGIGLDVLKGFVDTGVTNAWYFGPVYHTGIGGEIADFDVWSGSWTLGGFDGVGGTPFSIAGIPPAAVIPEPGALLLFAVGAALVTRATRRRPS